MSGATQSQVVLAGPAGEPLIRKTPDVCGGDACIRETRIMVWLLVALERQGMTDAELIENYPGLTGDDLRAAWEYARLHPEEVEEAITANERDEA
jgi:uncharacterized protein (DUF433 family)